MLAQLPLERNGELSLYRQLRAGIEMAIIDGELPDGAPLPSVRRLAASLNVAPITVVQAYRDLQAMQLIRSVPKRGYFVSIGTPAPDAAMDLLPVQTLLDEALEAALAAGLNGRQFVRLAAERANRLKEQPRVVAVVGQRDAALGERVDVVQRYVRDLNLNVTVVGLAFEDLEGAERFPGLIPPEAIECFLASVGEVQRAARLLGRHGARIMPMTRTLRPDVQTFIQEQPAGARFGVIADSQGYIERILAVVRRLHRLDASPVTTSVDQPGQIARVLDEADVIVIGSLAKPKLPPDLIIRQPHIDFISIPDERTLTELRNRLMMSGAEPRLASAGWTAHSTDSAEEV
ncbi:MAG: winged helix-turn-helix transcriptional regulator [Thermomicrobiales bacterium]|nr:winged helix-turn-helix transcriptional regulator [Thermomicrobiales bacterium]